MRTSGPLAFALGVTCALRSATAADDPPPVPTELKESVEVRLVVVDVIALDANDRTVSDLTMGDFKLFVDRKVTPIDTFDVACEGGEGDDPKSKRFGDWTMP